jgi:pyruvate/2-oxoglutarate dehydrogenase complex dihydrolipoamide dehydrogenase (E3) component
MIERKPIIGGIGVNVGPIPNKTMREAILYLSGYREHAAPMRGFLANSAESLRHRGLSGGERSIRTLRRPSMESCPAQFHHVFSAA